MGWALSPSMIAARPATWAAAMEVPDLTSPQPAFEMDGMSSPIARVRELSNYERSLRTRSKDVNDLTEVRVIS